MMQQRSDEWHAARLGKCTASNVFNITNKLANGKNAATRESYFKRLIGERLTGQSIDIFVNRQMQWGIDHEHEARAHYEFLNDLDIELVGFINHPVIEMAGASPDGLVGDFGCVEFKCPETHTHIDILQSRVVPDRYYAQIQFVMACTNRKMV